MDRTRDGLVAACVLIVAGWSAWVSGSGAAAAEPLAVTCSAERPTVALGQAIRLSAWAIPPPGQTLHYAWEATVGRTDGNGPEARWDLTDVRPGMYAASVRVSATTGASVECLLRVLVRRDPGSRGGPPLSRETGSALLLPGQVETAGYGLYSHLLLGSPPSDAARERYLKAIEAYVGLIPEIASLEQYLPRRELNIAYVPVKSAPGPSVSAEWVLANYDYARARSLLRALPGPPRNGPYIVSALGPLAGGDGTSARSDRYLFQDLSRVPPHLVASWVREFLNQAAQERFWEERSGQELALKLRLTVGILGAGLPEVLNALDSWIAWLR